MTKGRLIALTASVGLLAVLSIAGGAVAQDDDYPQFSGDANWETLTNRYIQVKLGTSGTVKVSSSLEYNIAGRWAVVASEGDPETSVDNNRELIWLGELCPCGQFGNLKVRVGETVYLIGDSGSGGWTKRPIAYDPPPSGYGLGRQGGYIDAEWAVPNTSQPTARIRIRMSVVRDQMRFEFNVMNASATTQSIGFGMSGDVEVGDSISMGYPYIAGIGYTKQTASLGRPLGTLLGGVNIPEVFEIMDSVDSPGTVARNILRQQDCVAPDYVAIGDRLDLQGYTTWLPGGYVYDPLKPVDDLYWLMCWNPTTLGPGASRKIVTYYGVGAATGQWNYRVGSRLEPDICALAVQSPRSIRYDSTTIGMNDLNPNPFQIKAYLYNMATDSGPYNLEDVTMSLYLPSGLTLALGDTASRSVGRVPVNSESAPAIWNVEPTGEYSGELEYFVTARDIGGWQQVVSRKVMVPATKRSVFRSGYQLIHVPFTFNNPSVEHALGLGAGSFGAKYYDPVTGQYLPLTRLTPGQSFWLYVSTVSPGSVLPFEVAADAAIVGEESGRQTREQYVPMKTGWNLVGNPFVYPMYWGQVLVANSSDPFVTPVSLDQAVTNGWLSKTVFGWVPGSLSYQHFKSNDSLLLPWRGYWVRAYRPLTLILRPPVPPASDVTSLPGGY